MSLLVGTRHLEINEAENAINAMSPHHLPGDETALLVDTHTQNNADEGVATAVTT